MVETRHLVDLGGVGGFARGIRHGHLLGAPTPFFGLMIVRPQE